MADQSMNRKTNRYADAFYINATSFEKPGVVDNKKGRDGKPIPITDPLQVYSGCYVRANINFYPFNVNGNCNRQRPEIHCHDARVRRQRRSDPAAAGTGAH